MRAGLVKKAEGWMWSSLSLYEQSERPAWYSEGTVARGRNWIEHVAAPQTDLELLAVRKSVERGIPYGNPRWQANAIAALGLESTLRPHGRPPRPTNEA